MIVFGLLLNVCPQLISQSANGMPVKQSRSMIALLRDPSGAKVQDATGYLQTDPPWRFASLGAYTPGNGPLAKGQTGQSAHFESEPSSQLLTAVSGPGGLLRFVIPDNSKASSGSGLVTTNAGLGALLPRLHAKRPPVITLQPMALVATTTSSEPFVLIARAILADGSKILLPRLEGTSIRLPAGKYEAWACGRDGLIWQHLDLQPGQRRDLKFAGAAQQLQLADNAYVHPEGMPELSLRQFSGPKFGGKPDQVVLRGDAIAAPLISWLNGSVTPARTAAAPATEQLHWPPEKDRRKLELEYRLPASPPSATTLLGLARKDDGSFRITAYAHDEDGRLRMPSCPPNDAWLLLLTKDHAPLALPWSTTKNGSTLRPEKGRTFSVNARDSGSLPITDLLVSYTPGNNDAATLIARADATGFAQFGRVTAPGTLRVSDSRYANQDIELQTVPAERLPLSVKDGESLTATARFSDGAPGKAIVVTLRDPSSRMRPRARSIVTEAGTPFTFGGLPTERNLVLIATAQRDGKTWSARQAIRSLDQACVITLRNEDPVLRPTGH